MDYDKPDDDQAEAQFVQNLTVKRSHPEPQVEKCISLLRNRQNRILRRVNDRHKEIQDLILALNQKRQELAYETRHYAVLERLIALNDGRYKIVNPFVPKTVRRKQKEPVDTKQQMQNIIQNASKDDIQKMLNALIEQLKGKGETK